MSTEPLRYNIKQGIDMCKITDNSILEELFGFGIIEDSRNSDKLILKALRVFECVWLRTRDVLSKHGEWVGVNRYKINSSVTEILEDLRHYPEIFQYKKFSDYFYKGVAVKWSSGMTRERQEEVIDFCDRYWTKEKFEKSILKSIYFDLSRINRKTEPVSSSQSMGDGLVRYDIRGVQVEYENRVSGLHVKTTVGKILVSYLDNQSQLSLF